MTSTVSVTETDSSSGFGPFTGTFFVTGFDYDSDRFINSFFVTVSGSDFEPATNGSVSGSLFVTGSGFDFEYITDFFSVSNCLITNVSHSGTVMGPFTGSTPGACSDLNTYFGSVLETFSDTHTDSESDSGPDHGVNYDPL